MKNFKVMVGRPVGLGIEKTDVGTFLMEFALFCQRHPRIKEMCEAESISSRILLNRNILMQEAIRQKCDFLLMIDPDMVPDLYCHGAQKRESAQSFLESSFQHLIENPFGVIAAPATGDPPKRLCNVFVTGKDGKGRRLTHLESSQRHANPSIEQVHAIGTGLILIHVPIVNVLEEPIFDDEYANKAKTELSLSQDIYFTQNCTLAGIPVWCNWYSWAGHHKSDVLGVPEDLADEEAKQSIEETGQEEAADEQVEGSALPLPCVLS